MALRGIRLDWIGGSGLTFTWQFPLFPWIFQETPAVIGTGSCLKGLEMSDHPTSFQIGDTLPWLIWAKTSAYPSGFASREVWLELVGLETQSKSRNHTRAEGRLTGMVKEGKEWSRHPSCPYSRFRACSLVGFAGPKAEQPFILLNSSQILPSQHDQCECQQLED